MITLLKNKIDIIINDTEPANRREQMIKAIAAAIRWNATCDGKRTNDDVNLYQLALLIEELIIE